MYIRIFNQTRIFKLRTSSSLDLFSNFKKDYSSNEFHENDIFEIRNIDNGSSFSARLNYDISREELIVIKVPNGESKETTKLLEREINNYSKIKYFFIPKYYGIVQGKKYPVIEFINGKTLITKNHNLEYDDKVTIIFQIITFIYYLHKNEFIYRDLKPNNIIIDDFKRVFLIDFDRMIKYNDEQKEDTITCDFSSNFIAPEVNEGNITYENDIYSIGQMIYYIMSDKYQQGNANIEDFNNDKLIYSIYSKCVDKIENRLSILDLMFIFIYFFNSHINKQIISKDTNIGYFYSLSKRDREIIKQDINKAIHYYSLAANQNDPIAQYNLGFIYSSGEYIERDINKAIHYYSLAANQNDPDAQFNLGFIYDSDEYIERDINKAIHYYSLAANRNYPKAQYNLGFIYDSGEYIERDINKAIHYYSLAANQNDPYALYNLGIIYEKGEYIERDINKAIHYYSLAANQNHLDAQNNLGVIYKTGEYIERDINKAIHYISLAANQNEPKAQYNLGVIYATGKYIQRDINKAIHFFSLAANQKHSGAQFNLGFIYATGEYIERDISKAIHFYSLAANQNHPGAQNNLGVIYKTGEYIERDINKAIHYYSLAANQNDSYAQYNLGVIYDSGEYIERDINKAIHYYSLAANQNHPDAQYKLGFIYSEGIEIPKNINRGISYFILSSEYGCIRANFVVGYFYHEGKYINKDMKKSIHYYKEGSSFNDQYCKNNLGIIYRYGYCEEIEPKLGYSNIYFEEAIRQKDDKISMYNLSHLYIYESIPNTIDKSINYLYNSYIKGFLPSKELLIIALIQKHKFNIELIIDELEKQNNCSEEDNNLIIQSILNIKFYYSFENLYNLYKDKVYLYNIYRTPIEMKIFNEPKENDQKKETKKNITHDFYEGFSIDI